MKLISLAEYAELHGVKRETVQQKCLRGGYGTAVKIGRNWCISDDEPYTDKRVTSGKYVGIKREETK